MVGGGKDYEPQGVHVQRTGPVPLALPGRMFAADPTGSSDRLENTRDQL
jgi:hypothetical protein